MPTACLHSVFRSSRYVPPVLFFYIPISVPGLYPHYAGVILSLPPLRYFPSIAYCVPRHERVELVYLHRLFWSLTVGGTDGLFFPFFPSRGPHSLV